ncbi:hypothetical protein MMC25_003982 [Agyrium rufum]|nr:hypothetical protein [Agyrium rufum]
MDNIPGSANGMEDTVPRVLPPSASSTSVRPTQISDQMVIDSAPVSKEAQVGITQFTASDIAGFSGLLKKRYTDFLVNEILPSGVVVHLDNLKPPKKPPEQSIKVTETRSDTQAALNAWSERGFKNSVTVPSDSKDKASEEITPADPRAPPTATTLPAKDPSATTGPKVEEEARVQPAQATDANPYVEPSETQPKPSSENHWQAYANKQQNFEVSSFVIPVIPNPTTKNPSTKHVIVKLSPENETIIRSYFDASVVQELLALFNRIVDSPHRKVQEYGSVKTNMITDRELRTKIHQSIRSIFSSRLESATDDQGAMIVTAAVQRLEPQRGAGDRGARGGRGVRGSGRGDRGGKGGRDNDNSNRQTQQQKRQTWQELGGDFLHFSIHKENKDTMEVIAYLARQLHTKPQNFQFAGTKDRRAITVQRASVYRIRAEQLAAVGRTLRSASIGNFEYHPKGLELGDLTGNEFVITLRDCHFGPEPERVGTVDELIKHAAQVTNAAAEHINQKGYINYYGLQRFGTFSSRTDTIGLKMLQGDFKGAVDLILEYSPTALEAAQNSGLYEDDGISSDDKGRALGIHTFRETHRSARALEHLPRKFSAEAAIIRHLCERNRENDYFGALQCITRNLRLMYVHAYQSLVWNLVASERWKGFGDNVVEGDLVLIKEHAEKEAQHTEEIKVIEDVDADGEPIIHAAEADSSTKEDDRFERARPLTAEEASSGTYTIFDIVLPTPGFDIIYPKNEIGEFYTTYMGSVEGGGLNPLDMRRKWKDVSLSGSYRKLIARPLGNGIEVQIRSYVDENRQFVETDLDRMEKEKEKEKAKQWEAEEERFRKTSSGPETRPSILTNQRSTSASSASSHHRRSHAMTQAELDASGLLTGVRGSVTMEEADVEVVGEESPSRDGSGASPTILPSAVTTTGDAGSRNRIDATHVPVDISASKDGAEDNKDELQPLTLTKHISSNHHAYGTANGALNGGEVEKKECKIAVVLKMQLGASQYATVALRELCKEGGLRVYKPDFGAGR